MNLQYFNWFFKQGVNDSFCNKVIELGDSKTKEIATIQNNVLDLNSRKSEIVWLNEQWIFDMAWDFVKVANKNANWNFEIDWCEAAQYTIYKPGEYYGWHMDQYDKPYEDRVNSPNQNGKIRKISCSLLLTDGKEYEGGDLEFCVNNIPGKSREYRTYDEYRDKGTLIFFPSFIFHRVKPVIKGVRKSLVFWFIGKPYK